MDQATEPYGWGRMWRDTLTAPPRARALFAALARSPAPGYGLLLCNYSLFFAIRALINLLHLSLRYPAALNYASILLGPAGGVAAVIFILAVILTSFLLALVVHACALAAGGGGSFARSYQIVSTLSLLLPLQALVDLAPALWVVPSLLGAYMASVAAQELHRARPWRARGVFALLAVLALGGQWFVRLRIQDLAVKGQALKEQAAAMQDLTQQLQKLSISLPNSPALPSDSTLPALSAGSASQPQSSLDMIRGPEPARNLSAPVQRAEPMRDAGVNMLNSLMPMLNNPALTKNMPPEQAKQLQELIKVLSDQQRRLQTGQAMTPQESAALAQRMQQMMTQMMQNLPQAGQAAPSREGQR